MAEYFHHQVNVEAAIAHRLHREADLVAVHADAADRMYRDLAGQAGAAESPDERHRLRVAAEQARLEAKHYLDLEARTRHEAALAVVHAGSLADDLDPSELQPVSLVPWTEGEVAAHEEENVQADWRKLRGERNRRLAASDWKMLPDSSSDPEAWGEYRQQLRELPAKTTDPAAVEWPKEPE